ncbi:MAG: shikimate dehydrogenase [Gloeobacteraceae cyanobacterium ES-bin-316]|nr:shikimate dehydrogenase [Ferruginibacter sp.]
MNLYALIGYPLGHSFSKKYFTNKFETEGLEDCFFELFPLEKITQFPALLQSHLSLKGLAVTIPYKQEVIPFLDEMSSEAKKIGAVNCIQIKEGKLKGFNTDVVGFEKSFVPLLASHHKKALILGTGGASKAVQYILQKLQIPFQTVSRRANTAEEILSYADVTENILKEYTIIINCTPLGMSPDVESRPAIPYQYITSEHYLYDLVYSPSETAFLEQGKRQGAIVKNGYEMLLLQAEENWRIWND